MTMLKREDYKAIKRMDRQQMEEYLKKIYQRGYEAGAGIKKPAPSTATKNQEEKGQGE